MTIARWMVGGAITLYFVYGVADAFRTGVANQAGTLVSRRKSPFHFWALISGWSVFAALIFLGLVISNV